MSNRYGHSAALIGKRVYIFAGKKQVALRGNDMFCVDLDRQTASELRQDGTIPPPRNLHSCSVCNNSFIIYGGNTDSRTVLSDLYRFSVGMYSDSLI